MSLEKKVLSQLAIGMRLRYDEKRKIVFGEYRGFSLLISVKTAANSKPQLQVMTCAAREEAGDLMSLVRSGQYGANVSAMVWGSKILLSAPLKGRQTELVKAIGDSVDALTVKLFENNYKAGDETGVLGTPSLYKLHDDYHFLCEETAARVSHELKTAKRNNEDKQENIPMGIFGALLGAILGTALILFIGRLGYISFWASIILGIAVVYFYEKFAGKFTAVSMVITIVIGVAAAYLSWRVDAGWAVYRAFQTVGGDVTFGECFRYFKQVYVESGNTFEYYKNLVLMAGLGSLVCIGLAAYKYQDSKEQYDMDLVK